MRVLIIEDDEKVGAYLKDNLQRENYIMDLIPNFVEVQTFLNERPYHPDLIILDRLLGHQDTKSLISEIKQRLPETRLLCLSAVNSPSEKATILDLGVDDYLGKPFSLVELQARVRALLRRKEDVQQNFFLTVGDLIIDLKTRSVSSKGRRIDLKNKEYALLINFAQNVNRVYSKYQLLDIIWEANLDLQSNVLEVTIMNLRKKLEESLTTSKIQSKRNVGYWFET
jgi:DNA-binding response OmpR family regulator